MYVAISSHISYGFYSTKVPYLMEKNLFIRNPNLWHLKLLLLYLMLWGVTYALSNMIFIHAFALLVFPMNELSLLIWLVQLKLILFTLILALDIFAVFLCISFAPLCAFFFKSNTEKQGWIKQNLMHYPREDATFAKEILSSKY